MLGLWGLGWSNGKLVAEGAEGISQPRQGRTSARSEAWWATKYQAFRQQTLVLKCPEYERLSTEVENVLGNLAQVTTLLLELFRAKDLVAVHRLDKELELTVGEKTLSWRISPARKRA